MPKVMDVSLSMKTGYPDMVAKGAEVYGPFAVHRSHLPLSQWSPILWTVTHIATGYAAEVGALSRESALRLARRMVRSGINWQRLNPEKMSKRTIAIGIRTKKAWREAEARRSQAVAKDGR